MALYSRCVKVTDYNVNEITSSVECDAYKYDPKKKKETKLSSLSQEGIAEQWPAQWKRNYVVSRVLYNGNKNDEQDRCDGLYVRPIKQASGIKTIPLSKGVCGVVNGIAFRGKTVGYTVVIPGDGSQTSQLRVTSINTNKSSTKLASQTFSGTADGYLSPVLDSSYIYANRGGKSTTSKWVRVQLSNKKTTQLEAGNVLAGSIARDGGTTTYVEVQGGQSGDPCAPVTPCRIVTAGADPFSSTARVLPPKLTLTPPGSGLLGDQQLPVGGALTQSTWQKGNITATAPIGGTPVQILRANYSTNPSGQALTPTSVTGVTDGGGNWAFTVPPPLPPFGYYAAVTTSPGIPSQSAVVTLTTASHVTLTATPTTVSSGAQVVFSGTVAPYQQSNPTVNILQVSSPGQTGYVTTAQVQPDGTFTMPGPVTSSGQYVAQVPPNPFDGSDGNATYSGTSDPVTITVNP